MLWLTCAAFLLCIADSIEKKVVVCNIAAWSVYRPSQGKFTISDVPPSLCTHIVYQFLGIDNATGTAQSRNPHADFSDGNGLELTDLRNNSETDLKILVSVGGWGEGSVKFSHMAASAVKRAAFVDSVVQFLRRHNLDGVNICWMYPTNRGGIPEDLNNFVLLLKDLKAKLKEYDKLLTIDISPQRYIIDPGYNLERISQEVDFINVLGFDFNGAWNLKTGINAPIRSEGELNLEFSLDYLIKRGAAPNKLVLGIPAYGRTYLLTEILDDGTSLGVNAREGDKGQWSREDGFMGYNELCYEFKTNPSWRQYWDDESSTPYAVNLRKFISYDNQKSVIAKVVLIKLRDIAGAMIWTIDMDDFRGVCHENRYPLTNTVKDHLNKESPLTISNVQIVNRPFR